MEGDGEGSSLKGAGEVQSDVPDDEGRLPDPSSRVHGRRATSRPCSGARQGDSILVRLDDLATRPGARRPVDIDVDAVLEEPNRAVTPKEVRPAIVAAGRVRVVHKNPARGPLPSSDGGIAVLP